MKEYYEIMEMEGRVSRGKISPLNVMPGQRNGRITLQIWRK